MKFASRLLLMVLLASAVQAQDSLDSIRDHWSQPVEPYRVIGNIYYVGASGISSHIIKTSEGIILMDTGTTRMAPQIQANIETLGFDIHDVKIIVASHAHWDHVEGHAEMQRRTGARVVVMRQDADSLATGVDTSALGAAGWEPVKVDRILEDNDTVTLGEITLTAHLTPGHTKGCTTWTTDIEVDGKTYSVVYIGGTGVNLGVKLLENERHPEIADDYAKTFRVLKGLNPDVFLAQHPFMYNMDEKMEKLAAGADPNPFIDPTGYREFIEQEELKYIKQLKREEVAARKAR